MRTQQRRNSKGAVLLATGGLLLAFEGTCVPENYFAGLGLSAGTGLVEAFTMAVTDRFFPQAGDVFGGESPSGDASEDESPPESPNPDDEPTPFP